MYSVSDATPVEKLGVPVKLSRSLHDAGFITAGDIRASRDAALLAIPKFGRVSLNLVRAILDQEPEPRRQSATHRPARFRGNNQKIEEHLNKALRKSDPTASFPPALLEVLKEHGMTSIANDAQCSRESIYRTLDGERRASFKLISDTLGAIGYRLAVVKRGRAR